MKKEDYVKLSILVVMVLGIILIGNIIGNNRNLKYTKSYGKIDKSKFAMYIKGTDGDYEKYDGDTWPKGFYKLNQELSYCTDLNGSKVDTNIRYANGKVTVASNKSVFCTLYFEFSVTAKDLTYSNEARTECTESQCAIDELYESIDYATELLNGGINNTLEAGLFRYQGYYADNYVCFGTTDKDTCTSDTDKYMYRIIGITSDGQLKLIKKEALNTAYAWNSTKVKNVKWNNSSLYNGLNGSYFLTNIDYVPSGWDNKIANTTWKYGSVNSTDASIEEIAASEAGFTSTVNAKIGLMYMNDYTYSYVDGKNCTQSGTCRKAWLSLSFNDKGAPVAYEWTMTKYGIFLYTEAWSLSGHAPKAIGQETFNELSVRPVFYLNVGQSVTSGEGTQENPYIIGDSTSHSITLNDNNYGVSKNSAYRLTPIKISNNTYKVGSFKINGEKVIGDTFIMPNENVEITEVNAYKITNTDNRVTLPNSEVPGKKVTLTSTYPITSFELNGEKIYGTTFKMPEGDVEITNIKIYTITNDNTNVTVVNNALAGEEVELKISDSLENKELMEIASFKMNGTTVEGNSFVMPECDVVISDVIIVDALTSLRNNSNYRIVDYLQFTGTQYIDTGIIPSNHTTEVKFEYDVNNTSNKGLLGMSSDYRNYGFLVYKSENTYYWSVSGNIIKSGSLSSGIHILKYNQDTDNKVILDEITLGSGNTIAGSTNLLIGKRYDYNYTGNVHYLKITDKSTGNLVRYFVPAVRNTDSVAGMYDIVNDLFYTNAGTGTFTVPE